MFQFTPFPSHSYVLAVRYIPIAVCGFPHSDICGSMDMCSSPQLFAAYHVLLRLPVPRHPPDALVNLTCKYFAHFAYRFVSAIPLRRSSTQYTPSLLDRVPRAASKSARLCLVAYISVNVGLLHYC